jgi:hypothetical protein
MSLRTYDEAARTTTAVATSRARSGVKFIEKYCKDKT